MRHFTLLQALGAAASVAMLAACSGGVISPRPTLEHVFGGRTVGTSDGHKNESQSLHRSTSFYSCPKRGSIEYIADYNYGAIYVYEGKFAGQSPCGQINVATSGPAGLFVDTSTHDLYAANIDAGNVLVYHKGQTTPYNTYTDPGPQQLVRDVTVARDGTVIASNSEEYMGPEYGSISTWIGGPNGGTFVGNFPMSDSLRGGNLTLERNGKVFFTLSSTQGVSQLWKVSCPAGACGAESQVAGVSFPFDSGILFDDTGDLLAADAGAQQLNTFELPNPQPSQLSLPNFGIALDALHHHFFDTTVNNSAAEYLYPSMTLIGTVPGAQRGEMFGIAVDP